MKNVRKICHYAQQMGLVCDSIENYAVNAESCPDEDTDPLAIQLMLNQLEQAQQLILGLTQNIMEAVDDCDVPSNSAKAEPAIDAEPEATDEGDSAKQAEPSNAAEISNKNKEDT